MIVLTVIEHIDLLPLLLLCLFTSVPVVLLLQNVDRIALLSQISYTSASLTVLSWIPLAPISLM
jgi:hypothetical protein